MKLKDLKPNPNNPRTISADQLDKLTKSIESFPKMMTLRPIIIDNDNVVLGGNMSLKALKRLGYKEIPEEWIKRADSLTEEEKHRFIIQDNVSVGEWDMDLLLEGWDKVDLGNWGLDLGLQEEEIDPEEDDFEMPDEDGIETDIKLGDLFEIGGHRLLCGSATEPKDAERLMGGELADLVITDPPYNVNYEGGTKDKLKIENDNKTDSAFAEFLNDSYATLSQSTKKGGGIYVFHASREAVNFINGMTGAGFLHKQQLIWVKSALVMGRQDYQWIHEPLLYGWKDGDSHYFTYDRTETTVIEDLVDIRKMTKDQLINYIKEIRKYNDSEATTIIREDKPTRSSEHPTMKPIKLIGRFVRNSSLAGEIVIDFFGGSGSTMVASEQLKRRCFMLELDPRFVEVIVNRMHKLDPTLDIYKNGIPYQPKL